MAASSDTIRTKVHQLADQLPPNATWDDVMYQIALQRSVEKGLAQADAGLLIPVEDLLKEYGLEE